MRILETAAAFGLPVTGSVLGLAITTGDGATMQLIASIIGAVCGVVSTAIHGYYRLQVTKQNAYLKSLETQAARYRRKLKAAGVEPDTEEMPNETV